MKRYALICMLVPMLTYGICAFVVWEPNPGVWSEGTRFTMAWFSLMGTIAGCGIAKGIEA